MSAEPPIPSTEKSSAVVSPSQSEKAGQQVEIRHSDGTVELVQIAAERSWSGILPRPEDYAKFGEIVPDAPERILRMAEKEQAHRIALESMIVPENQAAGRRGQWLGAGISAIALISAVVTTYLGAPWQVSVALVGVPVLSVARALVGSFRGAD